MNFVVICYRSSKNYYTLSQNTLWGKPKFKMTIAFLISLVVFSPTFPLHDGINAWWS